MTYTKNLMSKKSREEEITDGKGDTVIPIRLSEISF